MKRFPGLINNASRKGADIFMPWIKVAHITTVHARIDNRIFQKECKGLVKAGYEVMLIATQGFGKAEEEVDGVKLRLVPKPKNRLIRMTLTAWQAIRIALDERPAIFHFHDPELLPWVRVLHFLNKIVVYDMHENVPKQLLTKAWIPSALRPLLSFLFKNVERLFLKGIPVVYAENSYSRDYPWVDKSVVVLNMPLTEQLSKLNQPKYSRPTVGYIGGVESLRGSEVTLEALHCLKKSGVIVHWECVGPLEKSHEIKLRDFISRFNLDVELHGYVSSIDGCQIMSRCHIGLAVLHPIPNYLESYPTKMFEYMALGLPVIVSNFPLYVQVVDTYHCGLCVDPENSQDIAKAIQWLVENPAEAQAMGKRGRDAVLETFNWKHESNKLTTFYQRLQGNPMAENF